MATQLQKWICVVLLGTVVLRSYIVKELTAALILFALGFLAVALVLLSGYLLVGACSRVVVRAYKGAPEQRPAQAATRIRKGL